MEDIKRCKIHAGTLCLLLANRQHSSCVGSSFHPNGINLELPKLAMLLLNITPHAADPEVTVFLKDCDPQRMVPFSNMQPALASSTGHNGILLLPWGNCPASNLHSN